ncbi:uncharacterized protein JCM6883_006327 [Sporobolomyces salmoneus]|uniref:uncharacterized protein n=1 Tax=Sporobolomyces salmoneus TaxID=183962 RepID=UPI003172DBA3
MASAASSDRFDTIYGYMQTPLDQPLPEVDRKYEVHRRVLSWAPISGARQTVNTTVYEQLAVLEPAGLQALMDSRSAVVSAKEGTRALAKGLNPSTGKEAGEMNRLLKSEYVNRTSISLFVPGTVNGLIALPYTLDNTNSIILDTSGGLGNMTEAKVMAVKMMTRLAGMKKVVRSATVLGGQTDVWGPASRQQQPQLVYLKNQARSSSNTFNAIASLNNNLNSYVKLKPQQLFKYPDNSFILIQGELYLVTWIKRVYSTLRVDPTAFRSILVPSVPSLSLTLAQIGTILTQLGGFDYKLKQKGGGVVEYSAESFDSDIAPDRRCILVVITPGCQFVPPWSQANTSHSDQCTIVTFPELRMISFAVKLDNRSLDVPQAKTLEMLGMTAQRATFLETLCSIAPFRTPRQVSDDAGTLANSGRMPGAHLVFSN